MNIFPQGDEMFRADGKTDMTKLALCNIANTPNNNINA